jgi:hypothetical protein
VPLTPLPEALAGRPFLGADAVAAGLSRRVLSGGRFRRLFRDVFVETSVPDSLAVRCAGARLVLPKDAAFSHHTAAALRRLPVPDSPVLHALVPTATGVRIAGIRAHRGLESADVCPLGELFVTTIDRTFLDLAVELSIEDLVVFGDAALFWASTIADSLAAAVASAGTRRGVRLARAALPLLEPRAESPMETRLRLVIVFGGLPRPEANRDIFDEYGQWLGRPDLQYGRERIAIQYEGKHHRLDQRRYEQDILRDELLADLDWVVLKFTATDVFRRPGTVVERVRYHLVKRGALQA